MSSNRELLLEQRRHSIKDLDLHSLRIVLSLITSFSFTTVLNQVWLRTSFICCLSNLKCHLEEIILISWKVMRLYPRFNGITQVTIAVVYLPQLIESNSHWISEQWFLQLLNLLLLLLDFVFIILRNCPVEIYQTLDQKSKRYLLESVPKSGIGHCSGCSWNYLLKIFTTS